MLALEELHDLHHVPLHQRFGSAQLFGSLLDERLTRFGGVELQRVHEGALRARHAELHAEGLGRRVLSEAADAPEAIVAPHREGVVLAADERFRGRQRGWASY